MAKPTIKPIPAFDATSSTLIGFVWNGNTAYNNRIIIYDAESQEAIYDHTYGSNYYALNHTIPANTLKNGHKYAVQIEVIDINGVHSTLSDKLYFWTSKTPVITITNINDGDVINSSSLLIKAFYEDALTEDLVFIRYHLYDINKTLLLETDEDRNCPLTHTFKALENNTSYYIRITALTVHDMVVDTGYLLVTISYRNPNSYARLYTENDPTTGFVHYKSNIVVISPEKEDYTYDIGYIDLTQTDQNASFIVKTPSSVSTKMVMHYYDNTGHEVHLTTEKSDEGLVAQNYNSVKMIRLYGSVSGKNAINFGESNPLSCIKSGNLIINDNLFEYPISSLELRSLPITAPDYYEIDTHGNRHVVVNVGAHTFSSKDVPIIYDTTSEGFVTYFDLDGKKGVFPEDLYCDGIPVNLSNQTSIVMDPDTGYVKIIWRSGSNVTSVETLATYFSEHTVSVFFPLKNPTTILLDTMRLHDAINHVTLRYSENFSIPGDATSFVFKMKKCRKTAEVFKVAKGDQISFLVSSRVNEDDDFRLKLTVYGKSGSNYTLYSDSIKCDYSSVVYVAIKRENGIYGLYVTTDISDEEAAGLWLMDQTPRYNLKPYDLWMNLGEDPVYVDTISKMVVYQPHKPQDAEEYTIWIGDEE